MAKKEYYVRYRADGEVGRIARFEDDLPYGYVNGEWIFMPSLNKIKEDATSDYEEVDEAQAEKLIAGIK